MYRNLLKQDKSSNGEIRSLRHSEATSELEVDLKKLQLIIQQRDNEIIILLNLIKK